jgi:ArsR family transcriptional regulator
MNAEWKELAEEQATFCRVFGSTHRVLILWVLAYQELSVNEIAAWVGTSLQNISQHLSVLKEQELVIARRDGQTIYYQVANHERLKDCPLLLRAPYLD